MIDEKPAELVPRKFVILSGPMGGGKQVIGDHFQARAKGVDKQHYGSDRQNILSWTSRAARPSDTPGQYRYDVPEEDFLPALIAGELLEHVPHSGTKYGMQKFNLRNGPKFKECDVTGGASVEHYIRCQLGSAAASSQLSMTYILQDSPQNLVTKIMNREGKETKAERWERAARYPRELEFILGEQLPYNFIQNVYGGEGLKAAHEAMWSSAAGQPLWHPTPSYLEDTIAEADSFFDTEWGNRLPTIELFTIDMAIAQMGDLACSGQES